MDLRATDSLHVVEVITAAGAAISSLELFCIPKALKDDGLLSWRVQRLRHATVMSLCQNLCLDALLRFPGVLMLIGLRLLSVALLFSCVVSGISTCAALVMLVFINFLITIRNSNSNDGSDQMASIIILSSAIAEFIATTMAKSVALIFIAAQASLAYGTSGFLKACAAGWYDGSFVLEILGTSSYGNEFLLRLLQRHKSIVRFLGRGVVYCDCAMSLAMLLPPPVCVILLIIALIFHISVAYVMGLNTFLWSFGDISSYFVGVVFGLFRNFSSTLIGIARGNFTPGGKRGEKET